VLVDYTLELVTQCVMQAGLQIVNLPIGRTDEYEQERSQHVNLFPFVFWICLIYFYFSDLFILASRRALTE
jgi:hypothetical protein